MRNRAILIRALGTSLTLAVAASTLFADAFTYTTIRRQLRVGMVISSAQNVGTSSGPSPENPDPHVLYVLDSRTDLKPFGLEFVNPLAPPYITSDIYQRWLRRVRIAGGDPAFVNGTPQSQVFRVGARITKDMGAYWEVNLDTLSADDLQIGRAHV